MFNRISRSSCRVQEDTLNAVVVPGWRSSIYQLSSWQNRGLIAGSFPLSFSSMLRACDESSQWQTTSNLLETSVKSTPGIKVSAFNAAISDQGCLAWHEAFEVIELMKKLLCQLNDITWNSLLAVCEKSLAWEQALKFRNPLSFDCILSASAKATCWARATSLLENGDFRAARHTFLGNCGTQFQKWCSIGW